MSEINRRAIDDLSQLAIASSPGHRARSPSVGSCMETYGLANAKQLREPAVEPKLEDSNLKPIVFGTWCLHVSLLLAKRGSQ